MGNKRKVMHIDLEAPLLVGWVSRERALAFASEDREDDPLPLIRLADQSWGVLSGPMSDGDRLVFGKRGAHLLSRAVADGFVKDSEVPRG